MNSLSGEMAERLKAPVLKTGDVKASVGSNPPDYQNNAKISFFLSAKFEIKKGGNPLVF